jgi:hypothetical protein
MRSAEFKARAVAAVSSDHRKIFLYFADQWQRLAEENASIIDRPRKD